MEEKSSHLKENSVYLLERLLYTLDGEECENQSMLINIVARLKGVLRDVKRYL